nr:TlpA disulfide reductase family protein [Pedobacter sp. ASV19]
MKRIVLGIMLATPIIGVCQQQKFKIEGHISSVSPKAVVYLVSLQGSPTIDSCTLKQGKFGFSGTKKEAVEAILIMGNGKGLPDGSEVDAQSVYLENGVVHIEGKDSLTKCKIWGTTLNVNNQEKIRLVKDALSGIQLLGLREKAEQKVMGTFVSTRPASLVSLDWMWALGGRDSTVIANYPKLSASLRQTERGKELGMVVKASLATRIGQMAPDFSLQDQRGKSVKLSDFRGKYVLLDFWASWCHPCRELQPKLVELYNEFKATGKFEILAVSLDKVQSAWLKAIKEDNVPWLQVADLNKPVNKAAEMYNVTMIPASFLIDPDGKLIGIGPDKELLREKLQEGKIVEMSNPADSGLYMSVDIRSIMQFYSKDNISKADVLEDNNTLNTILKKDIGELAFSKELGKMDMIKDSAAFYGLIETKGVALTREKLKLEQQFVREHPDSFVSLYLLMDNNVMYDADGYAIAYDQLSHRLKNTRAAEAIRTKIEHLKVTTAGTQAKDFERKNQYGKTVKLSDYKGKLVLLDFWGSWCGVCRQGHPHLKELYSKYKGKGLEIVAVAHEEGKDLSKNKAAWLAAIKKDDVNWVHVLENEGSGAPSITKAYGIEGYPTKLLVDQDGKILMRVIGNLNEEMDQRIKSILDK